ncbi:hypothetical protein DHW03_02360 [Pedobacter yonginense]|uniref:Xylose isomerase-like TIM barrel domain-containing protein n=1 Tax=Pedobacter yonginense TaxID=651869 RepID=A0A317EP96_9SPHI|nr:sugar phosphate isomerase/epimerase family protein [Pedobacter yonginense]PWS28710.1 hypothetical protein DHW03_02360 [Pedobacter yonginense]
MKSRCIAFVFSLLAYSLWSLAVNGQSAIKMGIAASLDQDSLAYVSGFEMITESAQKMLSPSLTDQEFQRNLKKIQSARCKVITCNLFFPSSLKIAGPDVDEEKVLKYTDIILSRARKAGVKFMVLGSSGSRRIPDHYDVQQAKLNFVKLGAKLGDLAKKHQVTIVLENLETTETNFITSLKSAAEVVRLVNHPNFKLNVDIFHMLREQESPDEIRTVGDIIAFCEVAEKEKRTFPGVMGDDLKPYLQALKDIHYTGFIFIEGSTTNAAVEMPLSFKYLTQQIAEVYGMKK